MPLDVPNYVLTKRLGTGSFAEVWLAEHTQNKRRAAIKILKPEAGGGAVDVDAAFRREAELMAKFDSRNIVHIYDNGRAGSHAYIVMEYVEGGTLKARMQQGAIDANAALHIVSQIAAALDLAHARGIVHRDLKPDNILMRDATTPVLTDFGIARVLDRTTIVPTTGVVVGTCEYMSPEQLLGEPLDGRSDLYALGLILFELIAGEPAHAGDYTQIARTRIDEKSAPWLPAATRAFQPIVDGMLARSPDMRFANGTELVAAIRTIALTQSTRSATPFVPESAPPAGSPVPANAPALRRWPILALAAATIFGAGGTSVWWWLQPDKTPVPTPTAPATLVTPSAAPARADDAKPADAPVDATPRPVAATTSAKPAPDKAAGAAAKAAAPAAKPAEKYTQTQLKQAYRDMEQKKYKSALPVLRLAAADGVAEAQNNLGILYYHGLEVPHDDVKAVELFTRAARQKFAPAQTNLAVAYEKGHGVEKNFDKAYEWYLKAAEAGYTHAQYAVARYANNRDDFPTMVLWARKAAANNYGSAQHMLAQAYLLGHGVEKDEREGRRLMKLAAGNGSWLAEGWLQSNPD